MLSKGICLQVVMIDELVDTFLFFGQRDRHHVPLFFDRLMGTELDDHYGSVVDSTDHSP